jgi:hypothetical protein
MVYCETGSVAEETIVYLNIQFMISQAMNYPAALICGAIKAGYEVYP